jgi:hypothetical protein
MVESVPQSGSATAHDRSFGRVARSVATYGVMTTVMALTPLVVFVPTALFHCALRNGRRAAWAAAAVASALGLVYMLQVTSFANTPASTIHLAWASFVAVILAIIIPSLSVLPMVERGEGFGRVVIGALIVSVTGLFVTQYVIEAATGASPLALQVQQAEATAAQLVEFYRSSNAPAELLRRMKEWSAYGMIVIPAWIVVDIALVFVLSLLMLGRLRTWRDHAAASGANAGAYLFRTFTLPEWLLFAFVFGGLTPLTTGLLQKVAANVLAVVAFLYLLQGLAVFRGVLVAAGVGIAGTLIAMMLLGMLVIMGIGMLLLALAGLFDPFFHFRNFKRKDESHESHSD